MVVFNTKSVLFATAVFKLTVTWGVRLGTCPTCGASAIFGLKTKQCAWCGRITCNRCVPQSNGSITYKTFPEAQGQLPMYDSTGFCSMNCFNMFWDRVQQYPTIEVATDIEQFEVIAIKLWNQAMLNAIYQSNPEVARKIVPKAEFALKLHTSQCPAFPWNGPNQNADKFSNFRTKAKTNLAENLERCGRTQDSARIYEELRNYDKARELREKDRHFFIKRTDIQVNLNALLQQVKDGGIVAIFRCPHCGGKLKINDKTTVNSMRACEHCGSEIAAMDLADFLKSVLD